MNNRNKAFAVACVVELPLLISLLATRSHGLQPDSALHNALVWYHVVPLAAYAWCSLTLFGHGDPTFGSVWFWRVVFCFVVLSFQAILTSPLFFAIILVTDHARTRKRRLEQ